MNRQVLLAAAAAVALAAAPAVQADPQPDDTRKPPAQTHPQPPHGQAQQHGWNGQAQGQVQGRPGVASPHGQWSGQHAGGPQPKGSHASPGAGGQGRWQGPGQGQEQHGWTGQGQAQGAWQGQGRQGQGQQGQGQQGQGHPGFHQGQQIWGQQTWGQRPGGHADQGGRWNVQTEQRFDRRGDPQRWGETRHDWRGEHRDWDRDAAWRRDHDWWRGRPAFRLYEGPRDGFWFAPGYGYYRVPASYWERRWGAGDYLPAFLWEYQIADWDDYDLPPPPYGCAWVWINGGVALIDLSDGYILDIQYDIW